MRSANLLSLPAFCVKYIEIGDAGRIKNLSTSCREYEMIQRVIEKVTTERWKQFTLN